MDVYTTTDDRVLVEKDSRTEVEKINDVIKKTERKLFEASSVFPFDLFPNKIIIDENKINIIYKIFFFSEQVFPVFVKDVTNVTVSSSLLFATLTFEIVGPEKNPHKIKYLKIREALKAKRIIIGLKACFDEKIDTTKLSTSELITKVEEIGKSRI